MDDPKQCKDCFFWYGTNGAKSGNTYVFCNYFLRTGCRRVHKDGVCYSKRTVKPGTKRRYNPFMMEI